MSSCLRRLASSIYRQFSANSLFVLRGFDSTSYTSYFVPYTTCFHTTTSTMSDTQKDIMASAWNDPNIAEKYKIGENATRPFAEIMTKKAGLETYKGNLKILDVGTGTGAVIAQIYKRLGDRQDGVEVLASDISESMLQYVRERGQKEGWKGLNTGTVDGANITLPPNTYTHIFANFIIFGLPTTTLRSLHSILKPGGFIGVTTWSYYAWYPYVVRAINSLPDPPPVPTEQECHAMISQNRPWEDPNYVLKSMEEAGYLEVEVIQEDHLCEAGNSDQFVDAMYMPLQMVGSRWEEGKRKELVKDVQMALKSQIEKEFGVGNPVKMEFKAIIGMARKA